jgi:hypothetical protein
MYNHSYVTLQFMIYIYIYIYIYILFSVFCVIMSK